MARELSVEALVTGRVTQRGDALSVSAELVDAREDKQLWGEQYSRKLADFCPAADRWLSWKPAALDWKRRADQSSDWLRREP